MKAVFAVFLCACAWKDLKEKEIPLIFFVVAAAAGVIWAAGDLGTGGWKEGEQVFRKLFGQAASLLPGTGLLIISYCTKGAVGKGDGLFFLEVPGAAVLRSFVLQRMGTWNAHLGILRWKKSKGYKTSLSAVSYSGSSDPANIYSIRARINEKKGTFRFYGCDLRIFLMGNRRISGMKKRRTGEMG